MSNLLDKASVILTPTAYNNGEALCVKPSDGSGDFDFSRNSAATRVNAQGLVENVQILSSNLVQNGDFSEEGAEEVSNGSFSQEGAEEITNGDFATDSDWLFGGSASISNGSANFTGSGDLIRQNATTPSGTYKITFTVTGTGYLVVKNYTGGVLYKEYTNISQGEHTIYVEKNEDGIMFQSFGFDGSIESVSVREVGQDWDTFGTIDANNTVSFANNELTLRNDGSGSGVKQDALTSGKTYKVVVNVTDIVGNGFKVDMGNLQNITTTGTKTFYLKATTTSLLLYRNSTSPQAVNGATITNISVKEVGMDWSLVGDFEVNNQEAYITNASQYSQLTNQIGVNYLLSAKKYKLEADIETLSISGALAYRYSGGAIQRIYTTDIIDGKFTAYFTMPQDGNFWFQTTANYAGLNATITNISVIEITDDTNLPRINYEGFSYQAVSYTHLTLPTICSV